MRTRKLLALPLLVAFLASPAPTRAATVVVDLVNLTFSPPSVTIEVGDTVEWRNSGGGFHNVMSDTGVFSSGAPTTDPFVFQHTFLATGTFPYHCQVHGNAGMTGTVVVTPQGGSDGPGSLRFAQPGYTVTEGGSVTISVQRVGGDDGAVAVTYLAQTDTAGTEDFQAASGTLTWLDNDDDPKTFQLFTHEDGTSEPPESVRLTLTNPTGNASLGDPAVVSAVILDNDGTGGGGELTPTESACDGQRLTGLLARLRLEAPGNNKPLGVNLSLTATGDFSGLAYTGNGPGTPEAHLAFSTNPEETTLLRNPSRLQLDTISLSRNELNSDLVEHDDPDLVRVVLNPTLQVDNPTPTALLVVDNHLTATAARPGRGLAAVLARCHGGLGGFDVHVLRVLTKLARAEAPGATAVEIALYRAPTSRTYRLDAFVLGSGGTLLGVTSAELTVDGTTDVLTTGTLRRLPTCAPFQTGDCSTLGTGSLSLQQPAAAGEFAPSPANVRVTPAAPNVSVNFSQLLAGTTWSAPL